MVTTLEASNHMHQWELFTKWKARCRKCGHHTPWLDIVAAYKSEVRALRVGKKHLHV
jgi:hypothetical protein